MTFRTVAVVVALAGHALVAQNRFIVRTNPAAGHSVASAHGLGLVGNIDGAAKQLYVMTAADGSPADSVLADLRNDKAVKHAEIDAKVFLPQARLDQSTVAILDGSKSSSSQTKLNAYLTQPATSVIGLGSAHQLASGAGIVAVIDTGVDARHPLLKDSVIPGYDFIHNTAGYATDVADLDQSTVAILDQSTVAILDQSTVAILDQSTVAILDQSTVAILDQSTVAILDGANVPPTFGHGTMVAGLIHLVAPDAKIMPLRAFSLDGAGNLSDIVRAIYYAADNGAKVINMSFSMTSSSQELTRALNWANSKRAVSIASVANAGSSQLVYPAASGQALGVASTNNYGVRSAFSDYGPDVALAAPGEGLITTFPFGRFAAAWGTSFSTPLVSGTAALLAELNPNINQAQASAALANATPVQDPGLGWGVLNSSWACTYAQNHSGK